LEQSTFLRFLYQRCVIDFPLFRQYSQDSMDPAVSSDAVDTHLLRQRIDAFVLRYPRWSAMSHKATTASATIATNKVEQPVQQVSSQHQHQALVNIFDLGVRTTLELEADLRRLGTQQQLPVTATNSGEEPNNCTSNADAHHSNSDVHLSLRREVMFQLELFLHYVTKKGTSTTEERQ
jgi:hypothetical protein